MSDTEKLKRLREAAAEYVKAEAMLREEDWRTSRYVDQEVALQRLERIIAETVPDEGEGFKFEVGEVVEVLSCKTYPEYFKVMARGVQRTYDLRSVAHKHASGLYAEDGAVTAFYPEDGLAKVNRDIYK